MCVIYSKKIFLGVPEGRYGKMFPFVYHGMGMGRERGKPLG